MNEFYILGIDQSTQGTKGVLVNQEGKIISRADLPHRQLVNEKGWVSHDPEEIFRNSLQVCENVIRQSDIDPALIRCMGITNQRETTVAWDRTSGHPLADAIVWQCDRASEICERIRQENDCEEEIREKTGLTLTPYYPASKMAWLLEYEEPVREAAKQGTLALGTVDSYLVYRLTGGKSFRTDYSNASRTQLFHLKNLCWDEELCRIFGIPMEALPEVTDSDACFGETDLGGFLEHPIPICGVLGDSHGALFGHNCRTSGDIKVTYGTGSSVMMNTGDLLTLSSHGLSTSLAWKIGGKVSYVLEGNINYTGAVISWLKDQLKLISSAGETQALAEEANPQDRTYIVPAFTGLGAPWWNSQARAMIYGMSRSTGKNEIVKAACESIAYQINDVVQAMRKDTGLQVHELCVDGGPTRNQYLMKFQSNITDASVRIPDAEELSVLGAVFTAGLSAGCWEKDEMYRAISYETYESDMDEALRAEKTAGWDEAVGKLLN